MPPCTVESAKSVLNELEEMEKKAQACIKGSGRFECTMMDCNSLVKQATQQKACLDAMISAMQQLK